MNSGNQVLLHLFGGDLAASQQNNAARSLLVWSKYFIPAGCDRFGLSYRYVADPSALAKERRCSF
jgi:hypothetical protein